MNWKPGDDIGIYLRAVSDKMTEAELGMMWIDIERVVNEWHYKIGSWGDWESFKKMVEHEQGYIREAMKRITP